MKLTSRYLKQIIKEELSDLIETNRERDHNEVKHAVRGSLHLITSYILDNNVVKKLSTALTQPSGYQLEYLNQLAEGWEDDLANRVTTAAIKTGVVQWQEATGVFGADIKQDITGVVDEGKVLRKPNPGWVDFVEETRKMLEFVRDIIENKKPDAIDNETWTALKNQIINNREEFLTFYELYYSLRGFS